MKKTITLIAGLLFTINTVKAQTLTATFEDLTLPTDSFYLDTASTPFTSDQIIFNHDWTYSQWGDYWSNGFSYSNMTDSVTSGFGNQYSAKAAKGYNSSTNYAVGQSSSIIKTPSTANGSMISGMYVTNATYTYNSMRDGDMFAKKFGGVTGNDPDWFKLKFERYLNGVLMTDSIDFYLADFRFANNSQDYMLKTWEFVDLTLFTGRADSLLISVSSSDVGAFGMNTPAYFCIDNVTTFPGVIGLKETVSSDIKLNINPTIIETIANLSVESKTTEVASISIVNAIGSVLSTEKVELKTGTNSFTRSYNALESGIYFIKLSTSKSINTIKFVKN